MSRLTARLPYSQLDYYGVTFDHLVPRDDEDPDILQINIIEMDNDDGAYAHEVLPFTVDPKDYTMKKVLAVPRCCQIRKGTQDRTRINDSVRYREAGYPPDWFENGSMWKNKEKKKISRTTNSSSELGRSAGLVFIGIALIVWARYYYSTKG